MIDNKQPDQYDIGVPAKPWWRSRGVWGGLIAAGAAVAGLIGYEVDAAAQSSLVDVALALAGAVGGAVAVLGRVGAKQPVK